MTALLGVVTELCKRNPDPEAIAATVLGDLSTDEQRAQAHEAFAEFVRLTIAGLRKRGLSVQEVADALGVPDKQIYALVDAGEIGHVRIGRHIRVPDFELDRLLNKAVAA